MARIANDNPVDTDGIATDNIILPFQLQESGLRGRSVRLGSVLDGILQQHKYPDAISHLVADTITLAITLSSMLKYDGIFTLQATGKGAVKTLIADVQNGVDVRGCATYSQEKFEELSKSDGIYSGYSLHDLMGEGGYIAFTVDQGGDMERYQGIVSLEGDTLEKSIAHYFDQSEQLRTSLFVSSAKDDLGQWRSGSLMLQYLPDESTLNSDVIKFNDKSETERKEDWKRSKILLQTCTADEILSSQLHPHELLRRLFHEEGVIAYDVKSVQQSCRCSQERVEAIIKSLSDDDREHATIDGKIEIICEFCNKTYTILP